MIQIIVVTSGDVTLGHTGTRLGIWLWQYLSTSVSLSEEFSPLAKVLPSNKFISTFFCSTWFFHEENNFEFVKNNNNYT